MNKSLTNQYHTKMADIRLMLTSLKLETDYAESWKTRAGIDRDDVMELNKIIALLTRAYGVLVANEDTEITEAIRMAKAVAKDATPRHMILAPARQARKVPPTWSHPTDDHGKYIPLMTGEPGASQGESPDQYMPRWSEEEATHLMMHETTSEGTPCSPAFRTPEELAGWLAESGAAWFGSTTATRAEWLESIMNDLN